MKRLFFLLTLALWSGFAHAQVAYSWEDFCEEFFDETGEAFDEDYAADALGEEYQTLEALHAAPINLNNATREQLLSLPFLSEEQADSILAYRERKHGFEGLGELQFVSGLSFADRQKLALFVSAEPLPRTLSAKERFFGGKHELTARLDVPFYKRAGQKANADGEKAYAGSPLANAIRYRYNARDKSVRYGATFEKDAGEPFASHGNWPYDYNSFYFALRPKGTRHEILVGDYRLHWGEGLVFGNRFYMFSAQSLLSAARTPDAAARPNTGIDENRFFRGAAATLRFGAWAVSAAISYRKLDARITDDTIRTFQTTGYHRTASELARKDTAAAFTAAARVDWQSNRVSLGAGAYYSGFNHDVSPEARKYNAYYFRGKAAAGLSANYLWRGRGFDVAGELAFDQDFHLAAYNSLAIHAVEDLKITLQHRYFARAYAAPYARAYAAGSRVANQHAVLLAAAYEGFSRLTLSGYVHYARFLSPIYLADSASNYFRAQVEAQYAPSRTTAFLLRYSVLSRQRNISGYAPRMQYVGTHRLRLQARFVSGRWTNVVQADGTAYVQQTASTAWGGAISARTTYRPSDRLRCSLFGTLFFTDDYFSAVYAYEPQLRYTFAMPALFYHGFRVVALANFEVCRGITLSAKYAVHHYFNRDTQGTGTQLIASPTKQDLSVQVRFAF